MGLGNIISQTVIEKRNLNNLDWKRITRFAAFGYIFTVQFVCTHYELCSCLSGRDPSFAIGTMDWKSTFAGASLKPVKMMVVDQVS